MVLSLSAHEKAQDRRLDSDPGLREEVGLLLVEMLLLGLILKELGGFSVANLGTKRFFQEFAGQQTVTASVALGLHGRLTRG